MAIFKINTKLSGMVQGNCCGVGGDPVLNTSGFMSFCSQNEFALQGSYIAR
jgi:hypothetical protein